ncbi:MAG: hypothetical protein GF317_22385 [Candidatus Lokiarchaeota archaeon]|nr:hypothetical protein [Candidatus Lokiarchaeota archaeon]MBD3202209.1 hypothetical protein [Candidatus Lokiarchaeota archaeon]
MSSEKSELEILREEVANSEKRINYLLDKIELLEENIFKLEELLSDGIDEENYSAFANAKYKIELKEKDNKIRDLKDKLGFLRKENIELKRNANNGGAKETIGSVIRIEKKKKPLQQLVIELQDKLAKRDLRIKKIETENGQIKNLMNDKEVTIENLMNDVKFLKDETMEKNEKIEQLKDSVHNLELMYLQERESK